MSASPIIPVELWNLERVLFGPDEIGQAIPQRFEMVQVDAVTHFDEEARQIVGYKDVGDDEFWVRGHIPGRPVLPGVVALEALAQLSTIFYAKVNPDAGFVGLGGVDRVKFRRAVVPGDKLILLSMPRAIRPRRAIFDTQGWVNGRLAVQAEIIGVRM